MLIDGNIHCFCDFSSKKPLKVAENARKLPDKAVFSAE
jgi:hypothetical protein